MEKHEVTFKDLNFRAKIEILLNFVKNVDFPVLNFRAKNRSISKYRCGKIQTFFHFAILNFPAKICFTFMGWEMRFLKQCETEIEIAFQLSHKIREEKNEEKIG